MFRRFLICLWAVTVLLAMADPSWGQSTSTQSSAARTEQGVDLDKVFPDANPVAVRRSPPLTSTVLVLTGYSVLIVAASLLGGWLPSKIAFTHTRMQTIISFVGGLMLGIGVFHLMPHAINQLSANATARWMMVGIVVMFVLMRLFHFHNHEPMAVAQEADGAECRHQHAHDHAHDGDRADGSVTSTGEDHSHAECHTLGHAHGISWMGIALGLSVHTLIDGLALGASVYADAQLSNGFWLFGFGTFAAILFHKPLDAISITALMVSSGWSRRARNRVNLGFALMCPVGAALALLLFRGVSQFSGYQQEMVGTSLAFAAGVFICISLSDLLPEMEFHSHNKVQLTVALGGGIVVAWLMTLFHPAHL